MSVRPLLVFRGFDGDLAILPLQIDLSRVEAEIDAAFLMETDPLAARFAEMSATVQILMVDEDAVAGAIDALFAGLPVHSIDCDCEADAPSIAEAVAASNELLADDDGIAEILRLFSEEE